MNLQAILLCLSTFIFTFSKAQEGLLVAVQSSKDSAVVFDLKNGTRIAQTKVGFLPHEITFDPETRKCFVSNFGLQDYDMRIGRAGNSIAVIDPWSGNYIETIYTTNDKSKGNAPHGIKVRPGGWRELYTNVEVGGDSMLIYDLKTSALKRKFKVPKSTHNFIFSDDGKKLWLMAAKEGVFELDATNGKILHHKSFTSPIRGLTIGKEWIVASGKNEIFLLSKYDLNVINHFSNLGVGQILYSNVTYDQKFILCPAVDENIILVIDVHSGKVIHRLPTLKGPVNIQMTKRLAYVSHDEDKFISTIDLKNFKTSNLIRAYGTNGLLIVR